MRTGIADALNSAVPQNLASETYTLYPGKAHAVGSTGSGRSFIYDENGSMKSDGKRTYAYTFENMPRTVSAANGSVSFTYDGNGQRVKKTSSGGLTRVYIDKLYESGDNGKYIFAGDQLIALKRGTGLFYYHQDHLGSTRAATDASGNRVETIAYYPFGETRADSGSVNLNHKYTGQESDYETGLYNYNARLYDPELGRFVTADPIVGDPTNPQNLNRYSYVLNNPVNLIDPSGNTACGTDANGNYTCTFTTNANSDNHSNNDSGDGGQIDGAKLGHEIGRVANQIGDNFERFGQNVRDFFGFGDGPPPPPYPNSTKYNYNTTYVHPSGLDGVHQYGSGIPISPADCHMGKKSGLNYNQPYIPFSAGVSATVLGRSLQFQLLPFFDVDDKTKSFPALGGFSADFTFGKTGKAQGGNIDNIELTVGAGKHSGVGVNYEPGNGIVGATLHLGPTYPPSPFSASMTTKK